MDEVPHLWYICDGFYFLLSHCLLSILIIFCRFCQSSAKMFRTFHLKDWTGVVHKWRQRTPQKWWCQIEHLLKWLFFLDQPITWPESYGGVGGPTVFLRESADTARDHGGTFLAQITGREDGDRDQGLMFLTNILNNNMYHTSPDIFSPVIKTTAGWKMLADRPGCWWRSLAEADGTPPTPVTWVGFAPKWWKKSSLWWSAEKDNPPSLIEGLSAGSSPSLS